jgi:two-component system, NtrC family, response regulator HupR/HoxA
MKDKRGFVREIDIKLDLLDCLLQEKRFKEALAEIRDLEVAHKFDESSTDFGHFCYYSAEVFRKLGDNQTALDKAKKAFEIFKNTNENKRIAQIKYTLGNIFIALGDLQTAQGELLDSLATYKRIDGDHGRISVLCMLANICFQQSNLQMAIEYLLESIKLCEKIGEVQIKARGLGNLGTIFMLTGKWQLAEKNLLLNVKINDESKDWLNLCKGLLSLGYVCFLQRDFKKANKYYEQAEKLIFENNYAREFAIYHEYAGELEFAQGHYDEARNHYLTCIGAMEIIAPEGDMISQTYRLLAELQIAEKRYEEALTSCEKAMKVAESLGEKIEIGAIHRALGQIYSILNQMTQSADKKEKAQENFKKSISILEQIGAKFELGKACLIAGESNCFEFIQRVQYLCGANDIFKELESEYHGGLVQLALFKLFSDNHEPEKAILFLNDAEKVFRELNEKKELSLISSFRKIIERDFDKSESIRDTKGKYTFANVITRSQNMLDLLESVKRVKDSDMTILLEGETGTGKDLLAKTIHYESQRSNKNFVTALCSSIPETLLENALFGHVKGAYTGANETSVGLFEEASGGTLYLDEIADIPLSTQVKLLRAIDEKEITRIGETKPRKIDVRIISSTSHHLDERVSSGLFRRDLFFRLNVLSFKLPPLRERKEDILLLMEHFLKEKGGGKDDLKALDDPEFIERMREYDWPGNVRELKHEIERIIALAGPDERINLNLLKERMDKLSDRKRRPSLFDMVDEFEKELIIKALEKNDWVITKAAESLKLHEASLRTKLKKYKIEKPVKP